MTTLVRIIAGSVVAINLLITLSFAYGQSPSLLTELFSFELIPIVIKSLMSIGLLIVTFFSRPRSRAYRLILGAIATVAISSTAYSAFTEQLGLGDAALLVVGTLTLMSEAVEARINVTRKRYLKAN